MVQIQYSVRSHQRVVVEVAYTMVKPLVTNQNLMAIYLRVFLVDQEEVEQDTIRLQIMPVVMVIHLQ